MRQKVFSAVLAAVLLLQVIPLSAFAEPTEEQAAGEQTTAELYAAERQRWTDVWAQRADDPSATADGTPVEAAQTEQEEVASVTSPALSDGAQSLTPDQFDRVAKRIFAAAKVLSSAENVRRGNFGGDNETVW